MGALVPCVHFCRYGKFTACVHGAPSGTLRVPPPPLWQGRLEIRSVPLRGFPILASPVATGEVASNASRWGRLCLAFISDTMKVYGLRPWRPLRHTACATSPALAGEAGDTLRPLAGFLLLSFPRRYGGSGEQREPMGALVPCVHFCRYGWFTACVHGAPSGTLRVPPPPLWQGRLEIRSVPLRGYGFEIAADRDDLLVPGPLFPSPYGDMVLKSALHMT